MVTLTGLPTIADTVDDPDFHRFIERFMLREQGASAVDWSL